MAGALDTAFKAIAKQVVADLGSSFDSTITYTRKVAGTYNTATGSLATTDTSFANIKVPIEFVRSEEESGQEMREARIYITPDLIGDNQPDLDDEVTLTYAGSTRVAQITSIDTKQGGQTYLFTLLVRF
mgnify:CR=1 FL=1|tara:strand:- start:76 stop:462 length:387 start_codon:yes stop_codon:yes gene_type:complete